MVRYITKFLCRNQFVGDIVSTNTSPNIPRIGEEVRINGADLKVVRIVHLLAEYTIEIHLLP